MIQLSRRPGEGRTRYQRRIATTRALEAFVARQTDPVEIAFDRLDSDLQQTAGMAAGRTA